MYDDYTYYINNNLKVGNNPFIEEWSHGYIKLRPYKVKISGLPDGVDVKISALYQNTSESNHTAFSLILGNGTHVISGDSNNIETVLNENTFFQYPRFFLNTNVQMDVDVTIEILPEYPDALVFDGVDDYGVCKNMPIQTDYTVIAKRKRIEQILGKEKAFMSKRDSDITQGAFTFESDNMNNKGKTDITVFGKRNINIAYNENDVSYMTSSSYNGIPITKGDATDSNIILLGCNPIGGIYWYGAFYSAYVFNRSLSESEIKAFVRKYIDPEYLLPSERKSIE